MSRRWASLVLVALGLALDLSALPASAQENCFFVVSWSASGSSCGSGKKYMARIGTQVRECATGGARTHDIGPPGGCRIGVTEAAGYVELSSQCAPIGTIVGPDVVSGCGGDLSAPVDCSQYARKDKPGCVGDPVNLRTGALSLDPVDVDLGDGLRFARHYASDMLIAAPPSSATLPSMGYKWTHSLQWNVTRVGSPAIVVVTEPFRTPVPFLFDGTKYEPATGDAGSVTVDANLDVHHTNSTGTQTDFAFNATDSKYYLTQIRIPGELPIDVSPGPGSGETTFSRGTESLVVKKFTSGASAGLVSRVTIGGEQWDFTYVGGILKTVEGPDPSTPSTTDKT